MICFLFFCLFVVLALLRSQLKLVTCNKSCYFGTLDSCQLAVVGSGKSGSSLTACYAQVSPRKCFLNVENSGTKSAILTSDM